MLETQNIEAEMSVLGAIFLENESYDDAAVTINSQDFSQSAYLEIFAAMETLSLESKPIDLVSVTTELKKRDTYNLVGGSNTLCELVDYVPTASNISHYAKMVKDSSLYRRAKRAASEAISAKDGECIEDYLDRSEGGFLAVRDNITSDSVSSLKEVMHQSFKDLERRFESGDIITGIESGITHLDNLLCGFNPGDLVVIAGVPGSGKSTFVQNITENVSLGHKKARIGSGAGMIYTLEMPKIQWVNRIIVSQSKVDNYRFRSGKLNDSDWSKLGDVGNKIGDAKYFIDDTPGITISELRAKARRVNRKHNLSYIVVDYLQLMSVSGDNRAIGIGDVSRQLKNLAKELEIPIFALSQLNRKIMDRPDKRPFMSDLRESGAIEQDADIIIFAHRDAAFCQDCKSGTCGEGHEEDAELIVAKQRNGAVGTVPVKAKLKHFRFENVDNQYGNR